MTADGDTLSGTANRVVDADAADELLVAATGPDGVSLYAVDAAGPGVRRTPLATARTTPWWRVSRVMMRSASPSLWVRSTTASSR